MIRYTFSVLFLFIFATSSLAQDAGIQFQDMKVGTKLTIQWRSSGKPIFVEEYIGEKDGFHLMQIYAVKDDGALKKRIIYGYDQEGRQVFSIKKTKDGEKKSTYEPYSCHYVIGDCTHTYSNYNFLTKKMVIKTAEYGGRLDGDRFILTVFTSLGEQYNVPYDLGPFNLRVSSIYNNSLGEPTGYEFVSLEIPE